MAFSKEIILIKGGYWKTLLREKWSENFEVLTGIKPKDPWIQGFGASQYALEKPTFSQQLS